MTLEYIHPWLLPHLASTQNRTPKWFTIAYVSKILSAFELPPTLVSEQEIRFRLRWGFQSVVVTLDDTE